MGILLKKPILVAQCGHAFAGEAFWSTENTGGMAPDLWYENFPNSGRIVLTNQVVYVACRQCRNGLDEVIKDFTKSTDS
jgi:hypothetical protein